MQRAWILRTRSFLERYFPMVVCFLKPSVPWSFVFKGPISHKVILGFIGSLFPYDYFITIMKHETWRSSNAFLFLILSDLVRAKEKVINLISAASSFAPLSSPWCHCV